MSTEPTASLQPAPSATSAPANVSPRLELQFVLPEHPTNLKTVFGGASVIYVAAFLLVVFLLWLRPPVPFLTAKVDEPVVPVDLVFENVVGKAGGGGGGGSKAPLPTPPKTEPKPAVKPPEPLPEPVPVPQPPPPPDLTPPAATVPAIATNNQLALLDPNAPPLPGGASAGRGGPGAGGGEGPGQGPGSGPGLGPGRGPGTGGDDGGGAVDVQVVPLFKAKPAYTSQAMLRRVQGLAVVSCLVTASGEPANCRIIKSLDSNQFGLDDEAVKAALRFKFKPAMRLGKPVSTRVNIELEFNMR